jgi:F-type H+-transporting ATPase subunit delta
MGGVGKRYAEALLEVLKGAPEEAVHKDLQTFAEWLREVPGLRKALENPGVPSAVKEKVVRELASRGGFQEASTRFILLVVAHRRIRQWDEIAAAFQTLLDDRHGILRGQVVTARPLDGARLEALSARLEKIFGKPVRLDARVAPEVLGGVQLQIGSTVYDGSVAGALRSLRDVLVKG